MRHSFDYAVIRVVPRVEREEFINAGVVVFALQLQFLRARINADAGRLRALWPDIDVDAVAAHLHAFPLICEGSPEAGPIAQLTRRERFHWLVAPRSTIIQISPVHTGLCETPELALQQLFEKLVSVSQH